MEKRFGYHADFWFDHWTSEYSVDDSVDLVFQYKENDPWYGTSERTFILDVADINDMIDYLTVTRDRILEDKARKARNNEKSV